MELLQLLRKSTGGMYSSWQITVVRSRDCHGFKLCLFLSIAALQGCHFDGLVQERRNSSTLAMELRLSCTNPSTWALRHLKSLAMSDLMFLLLAWTSCWINSHNDCLFNSLFRLTSKNIKALYAVNWCVSRWNGRDTMDVINFFISRPGGLTHEKV